MRTWDFEMEARKREEECATPAERVALVAYHAQMRRESLRVTGQLPAFVASPTFLQLPPSPPAHTSQPPPRSSSPTGRVAGASSESPAVVAPGGYGTAASFVSRYAPKRPRTDDAPPSTRPRTDDAHARSRTDDAPPSKRPRTDDANPSTRPRTDDAHARSRTDDAHHARSRTDDAHHARSRTDDAHHARSRTDDAHARPRTDDAQPSKRSRTDDAQAPHKDAASATSGPPAAAGDTPFEDAATLVVRARQREAKAAARRVTRVRRKAWADAAPEREVARAAALSAAPALQAAAAAETARQAAAPSPPPDPPPEEPSAVAERRRELERNIHHCRLQILDYRSRCAASVTDRALYCTVKLAMLNTWLPPILCRRAQVVAEDGDCLFSTLGLLFGCDPNLLRACIVGFARLNPTMHLQGGMLRCSSVTVTYRMIRRCI